MNWKPNFKGNIEQKDTGSRTPCRSERSPNKIAESEKRRKKQRSQVQNAHRGQLANASENIRDFKQRLGDIEGSYAKMQHTLTCLLEKTSIPKFRSQQVDTLTQMIIHVEQEARRLETKMKQPLVNLQNLQARVCGTSEPLNRPNVNVRQPNLAEAQLRLKQLEDRLASLQTYMK